MVGVFAAIYHPVGLAIVVEKWKNTGMRIAVNGVWGNLGVASAALITGYFIDHGGWRIAFIVPGMISILVGIAYTVPACGTRSSQPNSEGQGEGRGAPPLAADVKAHAVARVDDRVPDHGGVEHRVPVDHLRAAQGVRRAPRRHQRVGHGTRAASRSSCSRWAPWASWWSATTSTSWARAPCSSPPRSVQVVFFAMMPGLANWAALACAMVFMLAAFGQIPINDYMIGRLAEGEWRARIYGVRYVVSFTVLAAALPLIAFVYENWGFDALFRVLAVSAAIILGAVLMLPQRLPRAAARAGVAVSDPPGPTPCRGSSLFGSC